MAPTSISLFSGAAGLDLGLERAIGPCRTVAYVEREAYACAVLAARMAEGALAPAPIWTDVTTFDGRPFRGVVDILTGGFPCQDISTAGFGAGITGAKSGLWKHYLRIIDEIRPKLIVAENVAALRTRGLAVILEDLACIGYDAEWGTLRAADVGAPHGRNRLFIVAYPHGSQLQGAWLPSGVHTQRSGVGQHRDSESWPVAGHPEPTAFGMADGVAAGLDRVRLTGNGVVPQQAESAIRQLLGRT